MTDELFGFTTASNKFKNNRGYTLAIEDTMNELNTDRGDCDWDISLGTSIRQRLFTTKTDIVRQEIMNEISEIMKKHLFAVSNVSYAEYDKGWTFTYTVRWLNTYPLEWKLKTTDSYPFIVSTGVYPLKD